MGLFGPEKMTLMLEQYNFFPGETIKGKITLNMKKPKKARELTVALIGERKERRTRMRNGRRETHTETVKVYNFKIPVGQEGEYQKGDFTFEIKIPENILDNIHPPRPDGALGAVVDVMQAVGGSNTGPVQWYVHSQLDVPMGLDIKERQSIAIA